MSGPSNRKAFKPRKKLAGRPPAKPWAHRHRLVPLNVADRFVGYACADMNCDELFTQNGEPSNPQPRLGERGNNRPMTKLLAEGKNHLQRRAARAKGRTL